MDRYCVIVIVAIFVTAVLAGDNEKEIEREDDKRVEAFWKRGYGDHAGFWKRDAPSSWYDDNDEKRAKYFLGKRAKYFLGKRMGEPIDEEENEEMDSLDDSLAEKRAKYFLGKRAKYFLGKRAKYFLGKRNEDTNAEYPEAQELGYELGKRQQAQGFDNVIRRAKYFLGKRAKYFLGKRSDDLESDDEKRAKYFLGKRGSSDDGEFGQEKRQQKYFLGKRSVDKQE